jgi:hypothetical protein
MEEAEKPAIRIFVDADACPVKPVVSTGRCNTLS